MTDVLAPDPGGAFVPPGIRVRLRSLHDFGADPLLRLLSLLGAEGDVPIHVGFYEGCGKDHSALLPDDAPWRLTVRPGTEMDWLIWRVRSSQVPALLSAFAWPDLVVADDLSWLIWSEDNESFLCQSPVKAL